MKEIGKKLLLGILFFTLVIGKKSEAQIHMKKVSLENQVQKSDMVIEGKVVNKYATWDANYSLIYTINTIEVFKVFKGNIAKYIDVVTVGGVVGLNAVVVNPSLNLQTGDVGVFTLNSNTIKFSKKANNSRFKPYALNQGFYKYNLIDNVAANALTKKKGITKSLYSEITKYTKKPYKEVTYFNVETIIAKNKTAKASLLAPSSLVLNKTVVSAGNKDVLTISGSDFGNTQGIVWFSNANDGGATFIRALDSQVLSWNDTQITVEVPSFAGTGNMYVEDAVGDPSPQTPITVSYAEYNVEYDIDDQTQNNPPGSNGPQPLIAYQVQHSSFSGTDDNVTWHMETGFNNDAQVAGAKAAFQRAFDTWICDTQLNWSIGTPTNTDVIADDGINIIRFDNGELDDPTLGICYTYYSGCVNGGVLNWYVRGHDIEFDADEPWHTGLDLPDLGEFDFQSVALHELGHGHQLGHVNDTNDLMNYAISISEDQRVIGPTNSTAANVIQDRSLSSVCGRVALVNNASCPLSTEENRLQEAITLYPNPSTGKFQIHNASHVGLTKAVIYDLSGRKISTHKLNNNHIIEINMLNTSSGVYFVNIHSDFATITKKLIVE
ncbi:T9SS type A sorting domain-containing protein [Seonamhaeicola algicola]|uniref:T9SS type A sorting domain-containing protein n=2 Tax=Seonamhaeicola algicola TaxID=1719036 RepID=A0A5C7AYK6_9FLAO|nr:T9SS type A sorting domain-containing protein [Seonamhaeicola algicola]